MDNLNSQIQPNTQQHMIGAEMSAASVPQAAAAAQPAAADAPRTAAQPAPTGAPRTAAQPVPVGAPRAAAQPVPVGATQAYPAQSAAPAYYPQPTSHMYAQPASVPVKPPRGTARMWAAFALAFVTVIIQGIVMVFGLGTGSDEALLAMGELAGGVVALLFVVALGGKLLAVPSFKTMDEAWRLMKWIFLVDLGIVVIELASLVTTGEIVFAQLWGLRVILLALLCAGVGIFEEALFRGLIFNGLLARMGGSKRGIIAAVFISAFIFGLMHIDPSTIFTGDISMALQAIFKVLQTGIFGFVAAVIVLRTQSLWPVIALHGLNDFMLMFMTNGVMSNPISTEYVTSGSDATLIIGLYVMLCALYMPSAVAAWRALKEHPVPDRGPFYPAPQYPPFVAPAPQLAYAPAAATTPAPAAAATSAPAPAAAATPAPKATPAPAATAVATTTAAPQTPAPQQASTNAPAAAPAAATSPAPTQTTPAPEQASQQ